MIKRDQLKAILWHPPIRSEGILDWFQNEWIFMWNVWEVNFLAFLVISVVPFNNTLNIFIYSDFNYHPSDINARWDPLTTVHRSHQTKTFSFSPNIDQNGYVIITYKFICKATKIVARRTLLHHEQFHERRCRDWEHWWDNNWSNWNIEQALAICDWLLQPQFRCRHTHSHSYRKQTLKTSKYRI